MGRHAKTDAQKIADGTFKQSRSETARKTAAVSNVLAFPVINDIPRCDFPLPEDSVGMRTFNSWCRDLIDAGLLTKVSLGYVTNLALADHKIEVCLLAGKNVPDRLSIVRQSALMKLEALNVDKDLVSGQTKKGIFGKNGFPARLRLPASHHARRSR